MARRGRRRGVAGICSTGAVALLLCCAPASADDNGIDRAWRQRQVEGNFADAWRRPAQALQQAEQALAAARSSGDLVQELRAVARMLTVRSGLDSAGCQLARQSIERATEGGVAFRSELFDIVTAAVARNDGGDCKIAHSAEGLMQLARELGDPARIFFVHFALASEHFGAGRYVDDVRANAAAEEFAITPIQIAVLKMWRSQSILSVNRESTSGQASARQLLEQGVALVDAVQFPRYSAVAYTLLGRLDDFMGDKPRSELHLTKALELYATLDESSPATVTFLAKVLSQSGRGLTALGWLDKGWPRLRPDQLVLRRAFAEEYVRAYGAIGTPKAYESGLTWLTEARRLIQISGEDPLVTEEQLTVESEFFERFGRHTEALKALKAANSAARQREQLASEKARVELQEQLNVAAKDKENAQLRAEAELQAAQQRGWIVAFAVAAVGVAVAGAALAAAMRRGRRLALLSAELEQQNGELERRGERLAVISRELEQRNGELEQRSASRIRLLAAACHDLRQPAHALGVLAELGSDAQQEPSRFGAWLQSVKRSTASLGEMLDELMDLGRLDGGHYTPQLSDVSLAELLQDVALHFGGLARRKGLTLEVVPADGHVVSDRHLLRRIVFNLVSNAIKYTDTGFVRVSAQPDADADAVQLRVQDSGPGIPPDKLDDVFRDYVRLNPTKAAEGLGIGLSIVRRAAELLGHGLTLASPPGEGTTVTLQLPLSIATSPAEVAPPGADATGHAQGTLVLLEDDPDVREAMAAFLQRQGYTVVAGADASAVLTQQQGLHAAPGLVITDLHLQGSNGLVEVARLREALQAPQLPALLVTGDMDAAIAAEAAQAQVCLAHKPLAPHKLVALVGQLLQARTADAAPAPAVRSRATPW